MAEENQTENEDKSGSGPFLAVILIIIGIIGFYVGNMFGELSSHITDWGSFGDYIGGLANPVIALAVLYYVFRSFQSNKQAMIELKNQTKIQNIEAKILIDQNAIQFAESQKIRWETIAEKAQKDSEKSFWETDYAAGKPTPNELLEKAKNKVHEYEKVIEETNAAIQYLKKELSDIVI